MLSGEDARLGLAAGGPGSGHSRVVLDTITLFPAPLLSTITLHQLRGPFPDLVAMPSGAFEIGKIAPWLDAGCAAISLGGATASGSLDDIARTAAEAIRVATSGSARPQH
ncbi:MAG: hypothetical protein LH471_10070 [Salinibacterium sp.]|nr:hypothetical protein [Salinibacterium sp.]